MLLHSIFAITLTGLSAASTPAGFTPRVPEDLSIVYKDEVSVFPGIKLTKNSLSQHHYITL